MPYRDAALKEALENAITVLRESLKEVYGEDVDRALVNNHAELLLDILWPEIESYVYENSIRKFEEQFLKKFPNHVLTDYGTTRFDYVVGNVQTAVVNEIISVMECWIETMTDAQTIPKFQRTSVPRDWEVATYHIREIISEVKQYRARGGKGNPATHTGSFEVPEID